MRYLRSALVLLALGAWAVGPLSAAAGAQQLAPTYQSSEPEKDAMMEEAPSEVRVKFSQPLDESSGMSVFDDCGNEIDSGDATVEVDELIVGIDETPAGMYQVVYKAVGIGGATGSSSGKFEFMVHDGTPCKGGHHHPPKHREHPPKHRDHPPKHGKHDPGHERDHGDDHSSGDDHGGHDMGSMSGGSTHSGHGTPNMDHGSGHGNHRKHEPKAPPTGPTTASDNPPQASGGLTPLRADAQAMLVGLGLALAVGVLGGWLLRMSAKLTA